MKEWYRVQRIVSLHRKGLSNTEVASKLNLPKREVDRLLFKAAKKGAFKKA